MNTQKLLWLLLGLLAFTLGKQHAFATASPPKKDEPQVLILTNEATLVGAISKNEAGDFVLQTNQGSSVITAKQVLQLCSSRRAAYLYLKSRANLRDPDERFRLARWCWAHELIAETIEEAEATLGYRPKDLDARGLLRLATSALKNSQTDVTANDQPTDATQSESVRRNANLPNSKNDAPKDFTKNWPMEDWQRAFTDDNVAIFTRQIQPIVLNGCGAGACHGRMEQSLSYRVIRPAGGLNSLTPEITRTNLLQTLKLIDPSDYSNSPLIQKALEPHGGTQKPPLGSIDSIAYQKLSQWVRHIVPSSALIASSPNDGTAPTIVPASGQSKGGFAVTQSGAVAPMPLKPSGPDALPPGLIPPISDEDKQRTMQELQRQSPLDRLLGQKPIPGTTPKMPTIASGTPPMLFQGEVVSTTTNHSPSTPEQSSSTLAEANRQQTKTLRSGKDPYDPTPFNHYFYPERRLTTKPTPAVPMND